MDWLTEKMHARDFTVSALVSGDESLDSHAGLIPLCVCVGRSGCEMMPYHLSGLTLNGEALLTLLIIPL